MNLREAVEAGEGLTNAQARRLLAGWKVLEDSGMEMAERADRAERAAQEVVNDLFWEFPERMTALIDRYPDVLRRPF